MSDYYPPSQDQPSPHGSQPLQHGPVPEQPSQEYGLSQGQGSLNAAHSGRPQRKTNGIGCISLFLGLVSFFFAWGDILVSNLIWNFSPSFGYFCLRLGGTTTAILVGPITAILGIVFSLVGLLRTQNGNKWLAVVGLVLSIIASTFWLLVALILLALLIDPEAFPHPS